MTEEGREAKRVRKEKLDGMSQLISFLKKNKGIELPWFGTFNIWAWKRENFAAIARLMGHGEKGKDSASIHLRRTFDGNIVLDLCMTHEVAGCRKVVVGQKWVEEATVVTPAHTEDKIEWVCDEALLAIEKEENK